MSGVPNGWLSVKIADLISLNPKNDCDDEAEVGFVPMQYLGTSFLDNPKWESRKWNVVKKGYTHFASNDVLLAKITPCFENGKAGIPKSLPSGIGAGSTEFFVCRPLGKLVTPEYLLGFFKTAEFLRAGQVKMTGSVGHKRVPKEFLLNAEIPLAPQNEQIRIADKLNSLLTRVDACREKLDRVPLILKRFRQSVLTAATSGALTEDWRSGKNSSDECGVLPTGWEEQKLSQVASIIDPNPSHRYPCYENGTVPILATEQFKGLNDWDVSKAKQSHVSFYDQRKKAHGFHSDDIIFARKGRLGLARKPPAIEQYTFSHTVFLVRANKGVSSVYLLWFLRQDSCVRWLTKEMNSNTGVPTLSKACMERLPVLIPPLPEQQEIVRRVDKLFALADSLETRYFAARKQVDQLTPSLLAKAFRGELVEQDPNDEPASVLLERIKAERANSVATRSPALARAGRKKKVTKSNPLSPA